MGVLHLILATVIAVVASFSLVFAFFMNFLLNAKIEPVKKDIAKLEIGQAKLEAGQACFKEELKEIKADIAFIKQAVIALPSK